MSKKEYDLPISAFLVLALVAENEMHGYEIERLVRNRGFQYWTDIQKSSIYNALKLLEQRKLISARLEEGGGPVRRVFRITRSGREQLAGDALAHLSKPAHPRNEVDLGIYCLPFLARGESLEAMQECLDGLKERLDFIRERLEWCENHGLELAALAFERPMLALEAELKWLARVRRRIEKGKPFQAKDWQAYEYQRPPEAKA